MKECLVSENVKGVMNNEHPINHMKKGFNLILFLKFILLIGIVLILSINLSFVSAYSSSVVQHTSTSLSANSLSGSRFGSSSSYISSSNVYGYDRFPSASYLSGQGIGLYGSMAKDQCGAGNGTDFLVQITPFGCSPSVVRSDLLEEQNVPVFCQLAATKLNPLIDVEAIDSITFSSGSVGGGSASNQYLSGVGFHPARAALSRGSSTLLNSPVLSNIGYAVIVLKRQPNEQAMPDSVRGNLTAVLRYDLKNSFGIGNSEFILPVIDDVEWNNNYNRYEFWQGKGFLRAEDLDENSATITLYQGKDNVLDRVILTTGTTGESSRDLSLPGFYCLAKLNVKLLGIQNPDTIAKLKVDDDYFDLSAGQRFLDNRCSVSKITKSGASQEVSINCREDDKSTLLKFSISPKVSLLINDILKEKISVGDYLYDSADGRNYVYLTSLDRDSKGKIFVSLGTSTTKVSNIYSLTAYNTF